MAIEKEDIVQYVQETPGNSNPAVLRSLLNQLEGSGEGATFKVEKEDDEKSYQSVYTGAEIDAAVAKAGDATKVTANPTLAGTESALEGLQVGDTKYKVEAGGNDNFFIVNITSPDDTNYTFDKTVAEINAAIADKKCPLGILNDNQLLTFQLTGVNTSFVRTFVMPLSPFDLGLVSISIQFSIRDGVDRIAGATQIFTLTPVSP